VLPLRLRQQLILHEDIAWQLLTTADQPEQRPLQILILKRELIYEEGDGWSAVFEQLVVAIISKQ
jgi:hypothetical protein